jgi:hypothetical protein
VCLIDQWYIVIPVSLFTCNWESGLNVHFNFQHTSGLPLMWQRSSARIKTEKRAIVSEENKQLNDEVVARWRASRHCVCIAFSGEEYATWSKPECCQLHAVDELCTDKEMLKILTETKFALQPVAYTLSTTFRQNLSVISEMEFTEWRSDAISLYVHLCFWVPRQEDVWESGGIPPHTLNLALNENEWSASRSGRFAPEERDPNTHWIGC